MCMQTRTHPAACLYPLVHIVGEGLAAHVAARPLSGVQVPVLQHDFALADDHQGTTAYLCALEDVILHSLQGATYKRCTWVEVGKPES